MSSYAFLTRLWIRRSRHSHRHALFRRTHSSSSSSAASTIFALSSAPGPAGVAVIRVSGPHAALALRSLTPDTPRPRYAHLRTLRHPRTGAILDQALALWFPGPHSFTGEDCAELHVHGGLAVVRAVLAALAEVGGSRDQGLAEGQPTLRPALAGEFTKRAFHAGKLDLTQVEGLGDLIHAETEVQRQQALRQMQGHLCQRYEEWRSTLTSLLAHLEAYIDFSESEDIEDGIMQRVEAGVTQLTQDLKRHLDDARAGERLRQGVHVAVVGEPNAGKSTLLNMLAQRPAAIVSPIAGTTRDLVEARLDLGGFPVVIVDTAGLRSDTDTSDPIEREGITRAVDNAKTADLLVFVIDAAKLREEMEGEDLFGDIAKLQEYAEKKLQNFGLGDAKLRQQKRYVVVNKMDLVDVRHKNENEEDMVRFISCKTNDGADSAMRALTNQVGELCRSGLGESPLLTRERHRVHLERACRHLRAYLEGGDGGDLAMSCQMLRMASREIGQLSGRGVSAEQILDVIFADFCIGK